MLNFINQLYILKMSNLKKNAICVGSSILSYCAGLVRVVATVVDLITGDDNRVDAITSQCHAAHVLSNDDWICHLVRTLLHVDRVAVLAVGWGNHEARALTIIM